MGFIEKALATGICDGVNLPLAYAHTPDEIMGEMSTAGFDCMKLIAAESIAGHTCITRAEIWGF